MNTLITRKEAIAAGLKQYFTGKACLNGHIAMRYVTSCACSDCITANVATSRATLKQHKSVFIEVRVRAFRSDIKLLKDTCDGLCGHPVNGAVRPTHGAGGTDLYRLRVPSEHADMIRATADVLINAHKADTNARLRDILNVSIDLPALPDWTERP